MFAIVGCIKQSTVEGLANSVVNLPILTMQNVLKAKFKGHVSTVFCLFTVVNSVLSCFT